MKKIAVIPARYAATRFPGKLLQKIGDSTIIALVYNNVVRMDLFDSVVVATDSDQIIQEIESIGGLAVKSKQEHQSGSDRIAEAIRDMSVDVVVNVQGDEPFVSKEPIAKLLECFDDPTVHVASIMKRFGVEDDPMNPNQVKVVCDQKSNALYFSRAPIPFFRDKSTPVAYHKHIGVYAFRKDTLLQFTKWPIGNLEKIESLEQLRYLENGVAIRMVETSEFAIGIDTPEDLERARIFRETMLKQS